MSLKVSLNPREPDDTRSPTTHVRPPPVERLLISTIETSLYFFLFLPQSDGTHTVNREGI